MRTPIEIKFDFPVALSDLKISLKATADLHHSEPWFLVHSFQVAVNRPGETQHSVLPEQEIKRIKRNGSFVWVHRDSEKESQLSLAIGAAIENVLTKEELGNPA